MGQRSRPREASAHGGLSVSSSPGQVLCPSSPAREKKADVSAITGWHLRLLEKTQVQTPGPCGSQVSLNSGNPCHQSWWD